MAAIIAFSRLYFFVHYPTDILGGIVLGTLDALLAVYLVKRLEDRADAKSVSRQQIRRDTVQEKQHYRSRDLTGNDMDRKGRNFDE
ncbi:MAG: phosphatase PAP2 family protein [Waltera sp.]